MDARTKMALGAAATILAVGYWLGVRPWGLRWSARDEELRRVMPGDEWVPLPDYETTKAISVDARPEHLWPWLAQMGRGRGGLYSFDLLDRLFGVLDEQSAQEILPQFQEIRAGDVIPVGNEGGFPVRHVEPGRSLVLAGDEGNVRWSWEFGLYPEDGATRLVSRNRVALRGRGSRLLVALIDPPAFIMTRQMLINLKRRAERLAAQQQPQMPAQSPQA